MKTLYILVNDCGDGSYSLRYTLDSDLIHEIESSSDEYCYPSPGFDGDGFNYNTLNIPDECSYESLGISKYQILSKEDYTQEDY